MINWSLQKLFGNKISVNSRGFISFKFGDYSITLFFVCLDWSHPLFWFWNCLSYVVIQTAP